MSLPVYIIRRLFFAIPLILGITVVSFIIANAIPADPINANLPQNALNDPELVAAFRERWGLDKSPVEQYFIYMGNLLQGDLGMATAASSDVRPPLQQRSHACPQDDALERPSAAVQDHPTGRGTTGVLQVDELGIPRSKFLGACWICHR